VFLFESQKYENINEINDIFDLDLTIRLMSVRNEEPGLGTRVLVLTLINHEKEKSN
jgi:hypothetical protein